MAGGRWVSGLLAIIVGGWKFAWRAELRTILGSYLAGLTGKGCWDWLVMTSVCMGRRHRGLKTVCLTFQSEGATIDCERGSWEATCSNCPCRAWVTFSRLDFWNSACNYDKWALSELFVQIADCQLQCCEPDCVSLWNQGMDHFHRQNFHLSQTAM